MITFRSVNALLAISYPRNFIGIQLFVFTLMTDYPDNPGPLPAEQLQNAPKGKGAIGNAGHGKNFYGGGDRADLVTTIQRMLQIIGYDLGTSGPDEDGVDGQYGDTTEKAVTQFQTDSKQWDGNPLKVDGMVGPETSDALNRKMVGHWYDHYQTPVELTDGMACHTATSSYMESGLTIDPGTAKKARIFIFGALSIAYWDTPEKPASMDDRRKMIWDEGELTAGQKVVFKVSQVGYGVIEEVEGKAEDGRATGVFSHWYQPKSISGKVALEEGSQFPDVKFTFSAVAPDLQKESQEAEPLVYYDSIDTGLEVAGEDQDTIKIANCDCILNSPFGTLACKTDQDGRLKVEKLPPGGVIVTTSGQAFVNATKKS